MGFKQHISRTWQMIEQQVNDVPFRPDDEIKITNCLTPLLKTLLEILRVFLHAKNPNHRVRIFRRL